VGRASRSGLKILTKKKMSESGALPPRALNPDLPSSISAAASAAVGFLESYGWYIILAFLVYFFCKGPIEHWWRKRQTFAANQLQQLNAERQRIRELQQRRWEEAAPLVYQEEMKRKQQLEEERRRKLTNPDGTLKKLAARDDDDNPLLRDDSLPRFRPERCDRGPGGRKGGGG